MTEELQLDSVPIGELIVNADGAGGLVVLALPYPKPPDSLWGNSRSHWRARSRDTSRVRTDVTMVARSAGLHRWCDGRVKHVTAGLTWAPGDRRVRDDDNLFPMAKVCFDAIARRRSDLIGLDLVPDDSPAYMEKLAPRILPPPHEKGMWLTLSVTFHQRWAT